MKRILILMNECGRFERYHYLIDDLSEAWQNRGLQVSYVYGVRERPEADLLIAHVDLTRTPPEYVEYIRSFPYAVNRDVLDISKRKISAHLLRGDEDFRGPVIVKTDNNCRGDPEEFQFRQRHPQLRRLRRKALSALEHLPGQRFAWRNTLDEYPIYDSLANVPRGVFRNKALVVEQFLPERKGDRYLVRQYIFLGDHIQSTRLAGPKPFVKRPLAKLFDEGLPVPEPVLDLRRRLGLDYGKIDYTIHAGQVVILDVNCTPSLPRTSEEAVIVGKLADGIWSLLSSKGNTA